ncbi:hypothetical protein QNA08_17190, partial [Chelatococcus sp. SYSU_G07232]|nr:hypothetical protein [Chelatococcus sp. SYSU_G07232]
PQARLGEVSPMCPVRPVTHVSDRSSLLPPENATGNFTKIVQRVPVRIRFAPDLTHEGLLRPGMSVVATVDTRGGAAPARTAAAE